MDEYFIPEDHSPPDSLKRKVPAKFKKQAHPWIQQLLQSSASAARKLIRNRLEQVTDKRLARIRDELLQFNKFAITFSAEDGGGCSQHLGFGGSEWDPYYLPPPSDKSFVAKTLNDFGLTKIDGLQAFVEAFDGLRNLPPSCAGNFDRIAEWKIVRDHEHFSGKDEEDLDVKWLDSVPIYYGPNGDRLLLTSKNELGWFCMEIQNVKRRKGKFADFIEYYSTSMSAVDSWSDPEAIFKSRF